MVVDFFFFTSETNSKFGKMRFCEPRGEKFISFIGIYLFKNWVSRNRLVKPMYTF